MKAKQLITLSRLLIGLLLMINTTACHRQEQGKTSHLDIHNAVITGNMEAVQEYIKTGADLNIKEPYGGSTPLITAAIFNQKELIPVLINAGADVNAQNKDGSTALISAAFFGRPEIVQLLLNAGADKNIQNQYGTTAYESVSTPFDQVKSSYDMIGKMLAPMGLKLDYTYLEKVRPEIAKQLQ